MGSLYSAYRGYACLYCTAERAVEYAYRYGTYSAVNMSESSCFAVVLAVICLPAILPSLSVGAQPTADETTTCGSSTSDALVNMFQIVASSQQDSAKSIKNEIGHLGDKIADVKAALVASNPHAAEPPKAALVSALECQHLISSAFSFTTC